MKRFIQRNPYTLLLGLVCLLLFITNYVPGSYVIGWDNLQTDLNPWLGVKRALFSVWEEYQSMGLTAGMAHAADLPRAVAIWILSFVLPSHMVRYVFLMGMVTFGAFGMFRLLQFCGLENGKRMFAFLGSLFYILNFATIQLTSLPYDPFIVFFGFLPWFLWIFLQLFKHNTKQNILVFIVLNFLGMSAFVPQQIFAVYIILLFTLFLGIFLHHRSLALIKRFLMLITMILVINGCWILPQIYFLATNNGVVQNTKQNQIVTEDILYLNKNKGNLKDFFLFNSFFVDNLNQYQKPIFEVWNAHRNPVRTQVILYAFAGIMLLGLFKKSAYRTSFALAFFVICVALLSNTPVFEQINILVRKIQIVNQIFRSPFTKFGFVYSCIASYLFSMGLLFIYEHINRQRLIFGFFIASMIVGQALPSFTGHYIATEMKIAIPSQYSSLISYLNTQDPSKRIALLPDYTFWGWFYNKWGYIGSGFLWYGIQQPIISRTFDVWSYPSESYFWEAKQAVEAEDAPAFQKVLEKYNVSYVLLDTSLLPIVSSVKSIQYNRVESLLAKSNTLTLEKKWGNLELYSVKHNAEVHTFTFTTIAPPNIGPIVKTTNKDTAYMTHGTYVSDTKKDFDAYYPFLPLTSQTRMGNALWQDTDRAYWQFTTKLPFNTEDYTVSPVPNNFTANLYLNNSVTTLVTPLLTQLDPQSLTLSFSKNKIVNINPVNTAVVTCGLPKGTISSLQTAEGLSVFSQGGNVGCFSYTEDNLDQRYGYIASVASINTSGHRLFFYVVDQTKEQSYIEDRLTTDKTENYIIAPRYTYGSGYTFGFQNQSLESIPAINTLTNLSLYIMPYDEIKNLHLTKKNIPVMPAKPSPATLSVEHPNPSVYRITAENVAPNTTLVLSQSFDVGWKAYAVKNYDLRFMNYVTQVFPFIFGTEIKNHVLVNNWENGWSLSNQAMEQSNNRTIVLVFLPQYLEYLGFLLLLLPAYWYFRAKT